MKNRMYIFLALLLVVPLAFALIGCGSSSSSGAKATSNFRVTMETADNDFNGTVDDFNVFVYNASSALESINSKTISYTQISVANTSGLTLFMLSCVAKGMGSV